MNCYLCASAADTRDHVPPCGFFPKPRPANLITVPCCRKCNDSYSKDDEAVRAWMCSTLGASPAAEEIMTSRVVPGIMTKSPAFRESLLATTKPVQLSVDGVIVDAFQASIDPERVNRFVLRVAKGLLAHHYPTYSSEGCTWEQRYIPPIPEEQDKLTRFSSLLTFDSRGEGVFDYGHTLTDTGLSGIWLMQFFQAMTFLVFHRKKQADT